MRRLLLAVGMGLALSSCVSIPQQVQLPAGQALLIAEATADGINHGAIVAANSGLIDGPKALTVKAGVDAVNNCVSGAHTIYASGNVVKTASELKLCFNKAAEVQTLIKGGVR